jgi:uncharacterized radical SAM superfamily Fe-S cluster-containing enzyme
MRKESLPMSAIPERESGTERLINETTSLCRDCKNAIPAQVIAKNGEVWMRKRCPEHGPQEVRLSTSAPWYEQTRSQKQIHQAPQVVRHDIEHGCPFDCGPCESHTQKVRLPVVTITSACNLDCPICYVHNKNDDAFHMGVADFERILAHLVNDHGGELDIVNLTGGEPTLHPHVLDFLQLAQQQGLHRVTICSNGVRLAKEEALVRRLGELNARIALSFDTFNREADYKLQGAQLLPLKLRCLELLEKYNVDTTLIPVMTAGVNDHEIGEIIEMGMQLRNIRHIEVHTMTYTGQGGTSFDRSGRISTYEVLQRIEQTTAGLLRVDDFVSSPCAHPLCYQIAYLLVDPQGGVPIPFTRFMSRESVYAALADRLYLEPTAKLEEALREAMFRLWSDGGEDSERTLRLLRKLLLDMFPTDRTLTPKEAMQVGERAVKAIYIHSHMDEETFDVERVVDCCDSNCYADGSTIPVCNYNVLFREKEARFNASPKTWNERRGGQKSLPILR